jgi:hypothetical protein
MRSPTQMSPNAFRRVPGHASTRAHAHQNEDAPNLRGTATEQAYNTCMLIMFGSPSDEDGELARVEATSYSGVLFCSD